MVDTPRILFVSDRTDDFLRHGLEKNGFRVTTAPNGEAGYQQLMRSTFALVVLDLPTAIADVDFIKRVRADPKFADVLILTIAKWGTGHATTALAQGSDVFEPKPIEATRLLGAVQRLLNGEYPKSSSESRESGKPDK
jgi:DNA-binding response OmpR family regulator